MARTNHQHHNLSSASPANLFELESPIRDLPLRERVHHKQEAHVLVDFYLNEVEPLAPPDRLKLLNYFFWSIYFETHRHHTSLAYELKSSPDSGLELIDAVYAHHPELLAHCALAIETAPSPQAKRRYELEAQQVERLVDWCRALIDSFPQPLIVLQHLEKTSSPTTAPHELAPELDHQTDLVEQHLFKLGWLRTNRVISQTVIGKLNLTPAELQTALAGPKLSYLMPQSEIHAGNLSAMVISQPIYLPASHRFVLLQDQILANRTWDQHGRWQADLSGQPPPAFTSARDREVYFLQLLLELPPADIPLTAGQVLQNWQIPEVFTAVDMDFAQTFLPRYAELYVRLMEHELGLTENPAMTGTTSSTSAGAEKKTSKSLSPEQKSRISVFLKRIIVAGIVTGEKISLELMDKLLLEYQTQTQPPASQNLLTKLINQVKKIGRIGQTFEQTFSLQAARIGFTPAVQSIDLSIFECLSIGSLQGFGLNKLISQGINLQNWWQLGNLTRTQLAEIVGSERAKKWQPGKDCQKSGCPNVNTWVGECGWCLSCELAADPSTNFAFIPKFRPVVYRPPPAPEPVREQFSSGAVQSVGTFVANLF